MSGDRTSPDERWRGRRMLHGMRRLPRSMAADDPRLPGLILDAAPLRLCSQKLPPLAAPADMSGHAARRAAVENWLVSLCGDYAGRHQDFMRSYLAFADACIARASEALAARAAPFDGLYAVNDWLWSALRPLPHAWLPRDDGAWDYVDVAFWTGGKVLVADLGAGIPRPGLDIFVPGELDRFWDDVALPATPFGHALPALPP